MKPCEYSKDQGSVLCMIKNQRWYLFFNKTKLCHYLHVCLIFISFQFISRLKIHLISFRLFSTYRRRKYFQFQKLISIKSNSKFSLTFAYLNKYEYIPVIFNLVSSYQNVHLMWFLFLLKSPFPRHHRLRCFPVAFNFKNHSLLSF